MCPDKFSTCMLKEDIYILLKLALLFRLPGIMETAVAEIKTQKKQLCWVPEKIITHCNKQNVSAPGSILHQG